MHALHIVISFLSSQLVSPGKVAVKVCKPIKVVRDKVIYKLGEVYVQHFRPQGYMCLNALWTAFSLHATSAIIFIPEKQ